MIYPTIEIKNYDDIILGEVWLPESVPTYIRAIRTDQPFAGELQQSSLKYPVEAMKIHLDRFDYKYRYHNKEISLSVYVHDEFMWRDQIGDPPRNVKVEMFIKDRAAWFFSYGIRKDIRNEWL